MTQHLLSSKKHLLSTDQDFQIKLNLESKNRLLREGDINSLFNLDEQFNIERQRSTQYRIYGKINLLTYDEITKITNINSSSPEDTIFFTKKFKEISNNDITLLDKNNWVIQILYPFSSDTISDGFDEIIFEDTFYNNVNKGWGFAGQNTSALQIIDGVMRYSGVNNSPIAVIENIIDIDIEYEITYEVKNLKNNGRVRVRFGNTVGTFRSANGVYSERLIPTFNNVIAFSFQNGIGNDLDIDNIVIKTKSLSKKKYRRLFKILTDVNDYSVFKSGFEKNIFNDQIVQFIFNKDIEISGLKDYLGRPISDLYLGIVKSGSTKMIELEEGFNRVYTDSVSNFTKNIGESYIGDEVLFDHNLLTQEIVSTRFHKFGYNECGDLIFEDSFDNNYDKGWLKLLNPVTSLNTILILNNSLFYIYGNTSGIWAGSVSINKLEIDKFYTISFDITSVPNPSYGQLEVRVKCGNNLGTIRTLVGTYTEVLQCTENGNLGFDFTFNSNGISRDSVVIDNIIVYLETGSIKYYKPFYKIDIKKFSSNIEIGNTGTTIGIPTYASKVDNEGNMKWKDLLDIGQIEDGDGVDYPFINDHHYLYDNYNLYVRKVSPINNVDFGGGKFMTIKPIDSTTIEVTNKFGSGTGSPLDAKDKCIAEGDKSTPEPGPSGPGTSSKDEENKNQTDNNDPKKC